MDFLKSWYQRYFSDPQVVILALLLVLGFAFVVVTGDILAPVLASVVIAYLLEGLVEAVERLRIPRNPSVYVVFTIFILVLIAVLFGLIPLLSRQLTQLFQQVPGMIAQGQSSLMMLPEKYPRVFTEQQVQDLIAQIRDQLGDWGQAAVSWSLASVADIITFMVYLILMPLMVFFFLKDKREILGWFKHYVPENSGLAAKVWNDVDAQIGNYVRGKVWEILIVWAVTFIVFTFLNLQFAMLLAMLVGLSVIVPYVGATVVTIPIAIIGFYQWGWSYDLLYLLIAYAVIQALDGNLLVPLLFSEVVNLHPVAIIVAVLFFGGIWGLWGVFFAIPLATLVQAVLNAWPRTNGVTAKPSGAEV